MRHGRNEMRIRGLEVIEVELRGVPVLAHGARVRARLALRHADQRVRALDAGARADQVAQLKVQLEAVEETWNEGKMPMSLETEGSKKPERNIVTI